MARAKKTNPLVITLVVGLMVLAVIFGFGYLQSFQDGDGTTIETCPDATGILTVNAIDKLQQGTTIGSPTIKAGINGGPVTTTVTSGTTTFAVGDKLEILVSKADYIDERFEATMKCGGLTLEAPLYSSTSDNPAIRIKNDDGDFVTDAIGGGATNQTNLNAGETFQLEVEFSGTNLEASGDGIYVIEFPAGSSANISSVTLGGKSSIEIPTVYTTQNAGSKVVAFDVSNIEGANKKTLTLEVSLTSGKDLAGGVYTDWFSKQWFIDDDGSLKYGVEDSDGDAKYENTLDSDLYINEA